MYAGTRCELHRNVLDAADEVGSKSFHLASNSHIWGSGHQLLENQAKLEASEICAKAEMGAATPESHVIIGGAANIESEWILKHFLVSVAGNMPHGDLVARPDVLAAKLKVSRCLPSKVEHRR